MDKKILVIGGGIGGLTAALALQAHGFQCEVFEQNSSLNETGAGIQISPNAMHVFGYLGLNKKLDAVAFEPRGGVMRNYRTGKAEMTVPFKELCQKRYGARYLHIHRADLLAVLEEEAKNTGIIFHLGHRVSGCEHSDHAIAVITDDGAKHQGDLAVGADGIHSVMRAQMLGQDPAAFTGQVAWRGTVLTEKLPQGLIPPDANVWLGPGRHFVCYYLRRGKLVNFVAVEDRDQWTNESWHTKGNMTDLRQTFAGWDPRIERLLKACEECFLWGLFDRAPLPRWSEGRVVLLGDACHPMLPFMAQGAAAAVEDGFVLARELADKAQSWEQALAHYEAQRKPRATMLQTISRDNAKMFHLRSPLGRLGRSIIFKLGIFKLGMFKLGQFAPSVMRAQLDKVYAKNVTRPRTRNKT